jgi:5-methylcytosine-specific restriction protein B
MQMHQLNSPAGIEKHILINRGVIGLDKWETEEAGQQDAFHQKMKEGDIVAIKHGAQLVALVEVDGPYFESTEDKEFNWLVRRRKVKILDWYRLELGLKVSPRGTLTRCDQDGDAESTKSILKWYNLIQSGKMKNQAIELLKYKKQIILQGPPGTGKTRLAKEIAEDLIKSRNFDERIHDVIENQLTVGLVVPMSHPGKTIEILEVGDINFKIRIPNGEIISQTKRSVFEVIKNQSFRKSGGDAYHKSLAIFLNGFLNDSELGEFKLIQFHPAYTYEDFVRGIVVETNDNAQPDYRVVDKVLAEFASKALANKSSNYVLIIDEINRANLPSVLGELIYALEYRFDPEKPEETSVESMYSLREEGNSEGSEGRILRLPNNLYIIGTMNTADRSVGHIDYAIRRRFAFVNVPPSEQPILDEVKDKQTQQRALELFRKVSNLFNQEYLNSDFDAQEVQLGHSYFLAENETTLKLKLDFEIIPLLKEYVKDGILNEKAAERIKELSV